MRVEYVAPAPVEDAAFKPVWLEDRGAFVCQRLYRLPNTEGLQVERYGARMAGPEGVRFSPLFLYEEDAAARLCEKLNAELPLG